MKSILRLGRLPGRSAPSIEARRRALLLAGALQQAEAAWVLAQLARLAQAASDIPRSWRLTAVSVDRLRQPVRGGWGQAQLHSCLPRLRRLLTRAARHDRAHQETTVRAWLDRRAQPGLLLREEPV